MKANRLRFDKLKSEYEAIRMRDAYIAAEELIIQQASQNQEWVVSQDPFGNSVMHAVTLAEAQIHKLKKHSEELIIAGDKAMQAEDYIKFKEIKQLWEKVQQQIKNLSSK